MDPKETPLISDATRRNWARLGADGQTKLTTRANKRLSERRIIPKEYILCDDTLPLIEEISNRVRENGWRIADVMYSLCAARLKTYTKGLLLDGKVSTKQMDEVSPLQSSSSRMEEKQVKSLESRSISVETTADSLWGHLISRASPTASPQGKAFWEREPFGSSTHLLPELFSLSLPDGEWDILGVIYQSLLTEGEKNRAGAYYTPSAVVRDMVRGQPFESGQTFLDPCCGSGSYLLGLLREGVPYGQLFGCDMDPIAVMIARTNLMCECGDEEAAAHIVCCDFLKDALPFSAQFDCILTNPPWGAAGKGESFAGFLHRGCELLGENGVLRFLLPDSFLNVRTHHAVRRHLLEKECLTRIRLYEERFDGVTTGCIGIEVRHRGEGLIHLLGRGMDTYLSTREVLGDADCIFSLTDDTDRRIFEKVRARGRHTLKEGIWALGIVTGDNRRHLKNEPDGENEPVYTGKEILPYRMSAPRRYIRYDRDAFQQCAKEEYYRAAEKLIYKFISDRPVFALDESGTLCLNSANILIPKIEGLSVRTVMALLNSRLYQYLYMKRFADVKILKGNLQKLPLPELSAEENEAIDGQARMIMDGSETEDDALQEYIFGLFELTKDEITRVFEITKGRNKS